jgi:hypothetical protein
LKSLDQIVIDHRKLRRTAIMGLPCECVPKQPGGGEPQDKLNLRAEVWRIATDLEAFKQKCIDDFNLKLMKDDKDKKPRE